MSGKEGKSCLEFIARDLLQVEEGGKLASLSQTASEARQSFPQSGCSDGIKQECFSFIGTWEWQ